MSKCLAALCVSAAAVIGCGSASNPKPKPLPPSVVKACPQATHGQGAMGECSPQAIGGAR